MHRLFAAICAIFLFFPALNHAQTGCPGCVINLPPMAADTLFIGPLPDGAQWQAYNQTISFRLPKTTTPVNAVDSTTPPGLPITRFEVVGLDGLPPGLNWTPSQWLFETATQTDGCVRICGTPTAADTFVLTVRLKATVFFLVQETSFPLKLYIAPATIANDGFTMSNYTGCGSIAVNFTNNIPSGGNPGFTYTWDFGDSTTFAGETPPPHTYDTPGTYPVQYKVTIDTTGYVLQGVTVLSADCTDPINAPDLYLVISNPADTLIYNSSPAINNAPLPWNLPLGIKLENGNYTVQLWDDDSGIKGTDDPCGSIPFNVLSGDTLVSGNFRIILHIERPVYEWAFTDTVTVYPQPTKPLVNTPKGTEACVGTIPILLVSSYGAGNQWWYAGAPIPGATAFVHEAQASGYFQVEVTNLEGCSARSDSLLVTYHPTPTAPLVTPVADLTGCAGVDSVWLNASYQIGNQWLLNGDPVLGATGAAFAALQGGSYQVLYTSPQGCTAVSSAVQVQFTQPPALPAFSNTNNLLRLTDTLALPANYGLQWHFNGVAIPGATGFTYCATASGNYSLRVVNLNTNCSASFNLNVLFNPAFDCTVGTQEAVVGQLRLFPNPTGAFTTIQFEQPFAEAATLVVWDVTGRSVYRQQIPGGSDRLVLDCSDWPQGFYLPEIRAAAGARFIGKLVIER